MVVAVQVMGCFTSSCMPVLMRSSCTAPGDVVCALRGLLLGLLGLSLAKLAFLGLDRTGLETAGLLEEAP